MKCCTLLENTACRDDLTAEHGLSLYLETDGLRILFDAGQTDAFACNAEKMGIDLSQVDVCVLSHGHYDHGGGLLRFLEINRHAPVYLSRHAFGAHHNGVCKYIGLPDALRRSNRLIFTDGGHTLRQGVTLHGRIPQRWPIDPCGLTVLHEGHFLPEDFRHEQYLLVQEGERRILISGCSHRGVCSIADAFRPDVLVGGFHLSKTPMEGDGLAHLDGVADVLLAFPARYYTGHCTGAAQFARLKRRMGDRLQALSTGLITEI